MTRAGKRRTGWGRYYLLTAMLCTVVMGAGAVLTNWWLFGLGYVLYVVTNVANDEHTKRVLRG